MKAFLFFMVVAKVWWLMVLRPIFQKFGFVVRFYFKLQNSTSFGINIVMAYIQCGKFTKMRDRAVRAYNERILYRMKFLLPANRETEANNDSTSTKVLSFLN